MFPGKVFTLGINHLKVLIEADCGTGNESKLQDKRFIAVYWALLSENIL